MSDMEAAANGLVRRDCPACRGPRHHALPAYSREPWTVVACEDCGFLFLRDAPSYTRLVEEVAWEKTYAVERERRRKSAPLTFWASQKLRIFHRLGQSARKAKALSFNPGPVLDVGCGGTDANVPATNTPYGLEISKGLHALADAKMRARGGHAVQGSATDGIRSFPDAFFSGAVLSSYLEHELQPKELLVELNRVLRPGGKVYVRVPNFGGLNRRVRGARWSGFRYPDHVNYFTVASLRRMTAECGFTLTLLGRLLLPVNDNINAVLVRR